MNSKCAAEWPDWRGETAVIVATGPSASGQPLDAARGRARFIAIKASWRLAPWADALYGVDKAWWLANQGAPGFVGRRFCPSPTACKVFQDVTLVRLVARAEILTEEIGKVGCGLRSGGGHSGFQAINLAVQFGATRIVLVGFDMTLANGAHWHDDYRGVAKPDAGRVKTWREALDCCASQFEKLGVKVINASHRSALKNYPKAGLLEAIAGC